MKDLLHVQRDGKVLYASDPSINGSKVEALYPELNFGDIAAEVNRLGKCFQIVECEGVEHLFEARALDVLSSDSDLVLFVSKKEAANSSGAGLSSAELEAIGKIAGRIGHDFNNLFGSIRGCVDLMKYKLVRENDGENPYERQMRIIDSAIQKGVDLTFRLRGFLRPEVLNQTRRLNLEQCLESCVEIFQQSQSLPVELLIVNEAQSDIVASEFALGQVITNLCLNAVDAMAEIEDRVLLLFVEDYRVDEDLEHLTKGNYVRLSVIDHGKGISNENLDRVKRPFFSTKPATTGKGFGLSLAMATEIMYRHGGYLQIASEQEVGTAVHLFFPAFEE